MPQKSKEIFVQGRDADAILALAYGAFEILGWTIKHSVDNLLIAYTPRSFTKWDEEITIEAAEDKLTITSKMIHDEMIDLLKKNEKHIAAFEKVFDPLNSSATSEQIDEWKKKISLLKERTVTTVNEEIRDAGNIDQVMHFSTGGHKLTYGLIGLNVLVFIVMVASGINAFNPDAGKMIDWGGNTATATVGNGWWRLITNCFLHFGIFHLLVNMYALFFVGIFLEPMLGSLRFITTYICLGVLSSLVSLWWHQDEFVVSAGASGAIFGMYGVFLALLTTNYVPKKFKVAILQSIVIFVAYNLLAGLKKGVDNAAHIGGLSFGLVIGYMYYFILREKTTVLKKEVVALLMVLGVFIISVTVIKGVKADQRISGRSEELKELNAFERNRYSEDDPEELKTVSYYISRMLYEKFDSLDIKEMRTFRKKINHFIRDEQTALRTFSQPGTGTMEEYVNELEDAREIWDQATYDFKLKPDSQLPGEVRLMADDLVDYCKLNKEKAEVLMLIYNSKYDAPTNLYNNQLNDVNIEIGKARRKVLNYLR